MMLDLSGWSRRPANDVVDRGQHGFRNGWRSAHHVVVERVA